MLSALAAVLELFPFEIPFPIFPRLTIDPVGIPIAIAAILYGPSAGVVAAGIAGTVITMRGNPIGASFKVAAEVSTVVPLALVLYRMRDGLSRPLRRKLIIGGALTTAVASRVLIMTGYNFVFLQVLLSIPVEVVMGLLPVVGIFNMLQGIINVVPAYLVVDRLPPDLKPEWLTRIGT